MSGHIAWRDDIRRICQCGHHKGSHAIPPDGRCLALTVPLVDGKPGCPCQTFEPEEEAE